MLKRRFLSAAAAVCLLLPQCVLADTFVPEGAVRLFDTETATIYGQYDPVDESTALYSVAPGKLKPLGEIENSSVTSEDYAVVEGKAYCCFGDPDSGSAIRLMRIDLDESLVAKAAEFQSDTPLIYVEPADGKLLLYGRQSHDNTLPMMKYGSYLDLYNPTTGTLKNVVSLESWANDRQLVNAATYDQGALYVLVEFSKAHALTYALRKYGMDGHLQSEMPLDAYLAAPGGQSAFTIGVSGDFIKVNSASFSTLFRLSTGAELYNGPRLELTPESGKPCYTDPSGAKYLLDMQAGTFVKTTEAPKSSSRVEAYTAMVAYMAEHCGLIGRRFIAFDTSALDFSPEEREAFLAKVRMAYPKSWVLTSTLDELLELGYAVSDGSFVSIRHGILITLKEVTFEGNTARFSIDAFVSGRGGYYISGAEMKQSNGVWTVTAPGSQAVS